MKSPGMNRVADKVALITGGGSGIGAATARIVCAEGGRVMLVDANEAGLVDTQKDIRDNVPGAQVATFLADVSEADLRCKRSRKRFRHSLVSMSW